MSDLVHQEFVGVQGVPAPRSMPPSTGPAAPRYQAMPAWMAGRYFESAETSRLNEAHWGYADDVSVNVWLASQLATIRSRATYEARQNGTVLGMIGTHADDIVGQDGPTLQVISDDSGYNTALESLWREWFANPTPRPNVSGASLLKLWIRSLWKCGEFLGQIVTDSKADGPVKMRIKPVHPRRLGTPAQYAADSSMFMGIRFDTLGRPTQYHLADSTVSGQQFSVNYTPVPADLVVHEFVLEEEDQARGIPWLNTGLSPAADLRDYDDQVQDAARQSADQHGMLYAEASDNLPVWTIPESTTIERRTYKMCPPGWKPFVYPAVQPPVQYPDYRAERQRELGRPVGMPLMMIRLDCARYNFSSARLETQNYYRAVAGLQCWLSGTQRSTGTLNRLVDEVAREGRFSVPAIRRRPAVVAYQWTWPSRPHVDPQKEAGAEETALTTRTLTLTDALAARGRDLETHVETLRREREVLVAAGLPLPAWMQETPAARPGSQSAGASAKDDSDAEEDREQLSDHEERIERLEASNG